MQGKIHAMPPEETVAEKPKEVFDLDHEGNAILELAGHRYRIKKLSAIDGSYVLSQYGRSENEKGYALIQRKLLSVVSRLDQHGIETPVQMLGGPHVGEIVIEDLKTNTLAIMGLTTASLAFNLGPTLAAMRDGGELARILSLLSPPNIEP
jgi:hypothetical protein